MKYCLNFFIVSVVQKTILALTKMSWIHFLPTENVTAYASLKKNLEWNSNIAIIIDYNTAMWWCGSKFSLFQHLVTVTVIDVWKRYTTLNGRQIPGAEFTMSSRFFFNSTPPNNAMFFDEVWLVSHLLSWCQLFIFANRSAVAALLCF